MNNIIAFSVIIFIFNIPFGYWRAATKRFSFKWYLAVHLPVPAVILLRVYGDVGWSWQSYAILIIAYFLGQSTGNLLRIAVDRNAGR
jgi:hypothetical protein